MTGWMNLLWIILLPLVQGEERCCKRKNVGGLSYSLSREGPTEEYNCLDHCIYSQDDDPGADYCFKLGVLQTECEDSLRIRKNLTSLTDQEMSDLLHALIEAKKSDSYTGPKIYGQANQNFKDFNSSYDAATSFHGYPGLCPRSPETNATDETGGCCIHSYSTFLPWHRLFMIQLEDALRSNKKYQHVTLPYWDWTQNFTALPHLLRDPFITDPVTKESLTNPFYHSWMPGSPLNGTNGTAKPLFTKRSANALINYTHHHCSEPLKDKDCPYINRSTEEFQKQTVLGDLVLTALEENTYESFETQIEQPHNQFHNQLGFLPKTAACFVNGSCYPYTMQNTYYASYDPIFLIFHTMVDFQWAIFQALQKYRGIPSATDCHPGFAGKLAPFDADFNNNPATKSSSRGDETIDYRNAFDYEYDHLKLFGMSVPELDTFLKERNNKDRLFAGFSLPLMQIGRITFNICHPITNCIFSSPNFQTTKVHKNRNVIPDVYRDTILLYFEVTKYLPHFGLNASQDIGFKIVSSTIPKNVTFTPVSIFRKAQSNRDRITVHWREDQDEYNYAPFFKVPQNSNSSMRFLLTNGCMSVYQYPNKEAFQTCSNNRTLVHKEIEITGEDTYYFQNPLKMECEEENKLEVNMSMPCTFGLVRENNGNAFIGWQRDMVKFREGICMKPGTNLTFVWRRDYHNVTKLANDTDFQNCIIPEEAVNAPNPGSPAPNSATFPPASQGGFEAGVHYFACPIGNHCNQGMKLKINVTENCDG